MVESSLVPAYPCQECACPVYVPSQYWRLGMLAPIAFFVCEHGPKNPRWHVQWGDLTPEQRRDLASISISAAIRVKNWSQPQEVTMDNHSKEHPDLRTVALAVAALKAGYIPVATDIVAPFRYFCAKLGPNGMVDGTIVKAELYCTALEALAAGAEARGLEPDVVLMRMGHSITELFAEVQKQTEENQLLKAQLARAMHWGEGGFRL